MQNGKGKGWKAKMIKISFTETLYECWKYKNAICFENNVNNKSIGPTIIDTLIYRDWMNPKLRKHIGILML
ncbi:unnamed protein product [Lathyrus oleraceus]